LGRVAGLLFAVGAHDGVPPGIGRCFPERRFLGTHESRRHVRNAVDLLVVEDVVFGILCVPKNVVVLGRPLVLASCTVVVCPDDFIEEAFATKDRIEEDLTVVHLPVVDMEIETAIRLQKLMRTAKTRLEEREIVIKTVFVELLAKHGRFVALSFEADAVSVFGALGLELLPALLFPGIEGRIYIDEGNRLARERMENLKVVAQVDLPCHGRIIALSTRDWRVGNTHAKVRLEKGGQQMAEDLFNPAHRFVETERLRTAYLHYEESRSPDAPTFVALPDDLEIGIVSSEEPSIARAISSLLTRSLEKARCDKGGHLPPEVVLRVQRDIISPEGVSKLWGVAGHRFVLARRHDERTHELLATILIGRSKDTIFFFTGRYNNLRYSTIAEDVDLQQPDQDDPAHRWFDRFAFPNLKHFKPDRYHHIANFVVSPEHRSEGLAAAFLRDIVRYYSRDVLDGNGYPIIHSQHLLCGRGLWQIGDPPWMARMQKLGFYRRWGAESFFIEHDWAPLPPTIIGGSKIDNVTYNRMYDMPTCYGASKVPHPSDEHLFGRVPAVMRLAENPRAKLQYFQAMFDFVPNTEQGEPS